MARRALRACLLISLFAYTACSPTLQIVETSWTIVEVDGARVEERPTLTIGLQRFVLGLTCGEIGGGFSRDTDSHGISMSFPADSCTPTPGEAAVIQALDGVDRWSGSKERWVLEGDHGRLILAPFEEGPSGS